MSRFTRISHTDAKDICSELKHGDDVLWSEADEMKKAVNRVLLGKRHKRWVYAALALFLSVNFGIYFFGCMSGYIGIQSPPIPVDMLSGLSPAHHPWLLTFIGLLNAVVISLVATMSSYD